MNLRLKSSNPALGNKTFYVTREEVGLGPSMTVSGTVNRAGILLLCVLATAFYTWNRFITSEDPRAGSGLMMIGIVGGLVTALVTIFQKQLAPITAPIYALFEGLVLGSLSAIFEMRFPGIAIQSVALTFGTCFCMLIAYRSGLIRPTQRLMMGIVAATGGIALIYLAEMMLGLFHIMIPGIFGTGPIAIVFSLIVATVAAFNLIIDFNFIEQGAQQGAPQYMEWYGAFGLMLTLIWLYMEILRLTSLLRGRR